MKAWITKYALSDGIIYDPNAEVCASTSANMLQYGCNQYAHGRGKDWHDSLESALKRAEEMRVKKIASLRKQIAKLETMGFKVKEVPR